MSKHLEVLGYDTEINTIFAKGVSGSITLDIIPDELLQAIQNKIKNHCLSNYQNYKPSSNVGYSLDCNDSGGTSNCNCDISGVNCYPANCGSDNGCDSNKSCGSVYREAGGDYSGNNTGKICNSDDCSTYTGP